MTGLVTFFGGLLVGILLTVEFITLRTRIGNTRLMLHVIWTRDTMTIEQIIDALRAKGQFYRLALVLCAWRMLVIGELAYDHHTRLFRLKGGAWGR